MWKVLLRSVLLAVLTLAPGLVAAQEDEFVQLIDVPTARCLPRGTYSLGVRVVPNGGLIGGMRVGLAPYLLVGVSYGARNVVGSGEPEWDNSVEFDIKVRVAEEYEIVPALAVGFDSRGYGRQLEDGGFEKVSPGFYVAGTKTLPYSQHWHLHFGLSRTLDIERTRPDFFAGVSARFSQEFSTLVEYQYTQDQAREDGSATGFLNVGFRWVFVGQVEIDIFFRNLAGPSGSPDLNSRSIGFVFYDSF